ncbi:MAG TPA: glycosyltransferase [Verrucomicrobiota bacterium]|nr:glycosyl transferase [Verrucomicrobiales bacterium]HRI16437.1 glycosyltransferase [Verrucomicrobiota bacterium]
MNDPVLISIVLPTYNGSRYLSGAVESVRRQTYPHWELLLQDDCSTDSTPELIGQLAARDSRIKPARNNTNLRLPRSLNAGFARALGDFLTWTSDDNEYEPTALAEMAKVLTQEPEIGLVYCDMLDIDENGAFTGKWTAPEPDQLGSVNSVGACFMYRREVGQAVGAYDDRWRLVEDWDYWLRVARQFSLRALHQSLYRYRRHEASLTATRAAEIQRVQLEMLAVRIPELPRLPKNARAAAYLKLARSAEELGDRERSKEFVRQARGFDLLQTLMVVTGRCILGARRAGAIRQWWRQLRSR